MSVPNSEGEAVRVEADGAQIEAPPGPAVATVLREGEQVERAWTAEDFVDSDWDHPDTRPRMRGWLHLFSFFGAIVAGAVLVPLGFVLGALAGVCLKLTWPTAPRWVGVPLYIGLGWVAVFILTDILHIAGVTSLVLLAVGGVLYTLGGGAYAIKKPNPWPGVFGYHEVFHAMTVVAAICHYIAVYFAMYSSPFV